MKLKQAMEDLEWARRSWSCWVERMKEVLGACWDVQKEEQPVQVKKQEELAPWPEVEAWE